MPTATITATAPRTATTYEKDTTAPAKRVTYSAGKIRSQHVRPRHKTVTSLNTYCVACHKN